LEVEEDFTWSTLVLADSCEDTGVNAEDDTCGDMVRNICEVSEDDTCGDTGRNICEVSEDDT
jgi:hypothetical protein